MTQSDALRRENEALRERIADINGSATTLLEDAAAPGPAEMREFFRIIAARANHMRGLIGDLLDAGRIEAGTLSVAPDPSGKLGSESIFGSENRL